MVNHSNIIFLFFSTAFLSCSNANTCINHDPCLCQINENDKIDISGLSNVIKPPSYLNDSVVENIIEGYGETTTYTFLGCKDNEFSYNGTNYTGTLIRTFAKYINYTVPINNSTTNYTTKKLVTESTVVGTANQIEFVFEKEDNEYTITYVNETDKSVTTIALICDAHKDTFLKIVDVNLQKLVLSSPKLCIITEHHGMSGGSVFLLILFISASIYFIGGAALLYFIRGARGAEMVPNIDFWRNIPGLVKDGMVFLLSGCKPNLVTTAETYDRI